MSRYKRGPLAKILRRGLDDRRVVDRFCGDGFAALALLLFDELEPDEVPLFDVPGGCAAAAHTRAPPLGMPGKYIVVAA